MQVTRNSGAEYYIPTEDEWYKAAYYENGGTNSSYWLYPTQSNAPPDNSLSLAASESNDANWDDNTLTSVGYFVDSPGPYGTFDMGGDWDQWNETPFYGVYRGMRGGDCADSYIDLASSSYITGGGCEPQSYYPGAAFRVAANVAVPEPGSLALLLAARWRFGIWRQRRKS